jgi:hypothetical protein
MLDRAMRLPDALLPRIDFQDLGNTGGQLKSLRFRLVIDYGLS